MKSITILLLHMQHGGIEKQTITFANELCKKYNVTIVSTYSMKKEPAYEVNKNIKIKYLMDDKPNREEFKLAIKSKNPFKIIKEAVKAIKILYLKKKLMIKEIKSLHTDFILSTRIEYAEMLSKYANKGVTTITQEHLHDDSKKYVNKVKKSFKNLDYLVVLAPGSKENYSKWLEDNKKTKIIEIPNILASIPDNSSNLSGNNIISVGRLHPVKDFNTLILVFEKVIKKIPSTTLTIVGGGDEYDNLQQLVKDLNLENNITITGMLDKEQVEEKMINSDLYVMTSLTECFPMVLLEASSCGLPLIAFDVPVGPKAIIKDRINGYLIENRKIEEMSNKIIELLNNREELKALGRTSKEMSKNYLPDIIMNKWDIIFEK